MSTHSSDSSLYYDENKSCDYSGYSHEYHCRNCSKIHAVEESQAAAQHRAEDRMKLVTAEIQRLEALNTHELTSEYIERYGINGYGGTDKDRRLKLIWAFIGRNKPDLEYRKANEIYDSLVSGIEKPKVKTVAPRMEDVFKSLEQTLMYTTYRFDKAKMYDALASKDETLAHKLSVLDKYRYSNRKIFARECDVNNYMATIDEAYSILQNGQSQ